MPQAHGKHARSHSCTGGSGGVTRKKRIGDVPGRSLRQCATKMMGSRATHGRGARAGLSSDGQEPSLAGFRLSAPDVSAREAAAKLIIEVEQKKKEFDALKRSGGGGVAGAEEEEEASATGRSTRPVVNTCLKKYYHDFINVVSISDVLLQVLDARDPMACRLTRAEEEIRSRYNERKQFILVLNKIDLIPHEIAIQWVEYFTLKGHRCIPFSTARQSLETETGQLTRRCIDQLYAELRNITRCPTTGCHRSITVGVIGYPNVGKSSLINALKRKAVVGVANQAGSTRGLIEVDLRKNIKIVDCPGILFDMNQKPEDLVLLNAVRLSEVSDPISVVNHVGSRVGWDRLCQHYQIPFASDLTSFLRHLCRKQGRLLSGGGGYDETGCAKGLLRDWNTSAIPFYALPPVEKAWVPSVLQDEDAGPTDAVLVLRRGPDPVVTSFADNAMRHLFDGGRDRAGNLLPQSQYDMMDPDNTSHPSSRVMKKTERRT